jgi:hypothetical protein
MMCKFVSNLSYEEHYSEEVCLERKNRIRLAFAAYAYEFESDSIMSDGEYDELSKKIRPHMKTGRDLLDDFFRDKFSTDTGQWIHDHPELDTLKAMYFLYKNPNKGYYRQKHRLYKLVNQ